MFWLFFRSGFTHRHLVWGIVFLRCRVLSVIDWVRVGEKVGKIPQNPFLAIYAMWLVKEVMKSWDRV